MKRQGEYTPPQSKSSASFKSSKSLDTKDKGSELPEDIDKRIVYYVGTKDPRKFADICDEDPDTFVPSIRRKCQYRVQYFRKKINHHRLEYFIRKYFPHQLYLFHSFLSQRPTPPNLPDDSSGLETPSIASSSIRSIRRNITPSPWTSPPIPRNIMSSLVSAAADPELNNLFQLHFDDPTRNPYGVRVLRLSDVSTGISLVGMIVIYMALNNLNDIKHFAPRLSEDGSMLIVNREAQPSPIFPENVALIQYFTASDGKETDDKTYINALDVQAEMVRKSKMMGGFNKDFYYKFPNGITCNSDHFNPNKKGQLGVDAEMVLLPYTTHSPLPG